MKEKRFSDRSYLRLFFQSFFLLAPLLTAFSPAAAQHNAVPGEFILKFSDKISPRQAQTAQRQLGILVVDTHALTKAKLVRTLDNSSLDTTLAKELLANGIVEYVEPNYIVSIHQSTPNDPQYNQLWGLHNTNQTGGTTDADIDAPEAWGLFRGSESVVIGVVDTGVDYNHPDLAANIWRNPREVAGNNFDDDGNGVIDDVFGYDAISGSGNPNDENGHGTHCAGTIAAVGNNDTGVVGVNWNAKILPLKFLDASGFGNTDDAIRAIEYAVRLKNSGVNIRVLSNSWGGAGYSQALADAIQLASDAGILFVAAAGNSAADNDLEPNYPSNYENANVVAVAAVDHDGNLASFSNYGLETVDLAAPGVNILSTLPGGNYGLLSGTSMATPHVAGVAGLLAGYSPTLNVAALKDRLLNTIQLNNNLQGITRYPGIVNAANSLSDSRAPLPPTGPIVSYTARPRAFSEHKPYGERYLQADDGMVEVSLPFSFPYYSQQYSRIAISANGRIIPLGEGQELPDPADFGNRVMEGIGVYHDDLFPSPLSTEGGVWVRYEAQALVVTWIAVHYIDRNSSDPIAELRFQARLRSDGEIETHYIDTAVGDSFYDYGGSATVSLAPVRGTGGRSLQVLHNSADFDKVSSGRALHFVKQSTTLGSAKGDVDGDGRRDIVVWRPQFGLWFVLTSASGYDFSSHLQYQHGLPGDVPLLGDFDRDGRSDLVVWRPANGTWYFRYSGSSFTTVNAIQWGLPGDHPLLGDFDGDSYQDLAVYRSNTGSFYVLLSSAGFNNLAAFAGDNRAYLYVNLGGHGHDPVVGDFTGEGKANFTTIWQQVRFWTLKDANNQIIYSLPWGYQGDTPLACDFDGNKRDERVMVRIGETYNLLWFGVDHLGPVSTGLFGSIFDTPLCHDYDGDNKDDYTVFRNATGEWFISDSSTGNLRSYQFGLPGDMPL